MTGPLCRNCGTPIGKTSRMVNLVLQRTKYQRDHHSDHGGGSRYLLVDAFPTSKAECQKLTNWQVIAVMWAKVYHDDGSVTKPHIRQFHEWDGEHFKDKFFCKGSCAQEFAYLLADEGRCTRRYNDAVSARAGRGS